MITINIAFSGRNSKTVLGMYTGFEMEENLKKISKFILHTNDDYRIRRALGKCNVINVKVEDKVLQINFDMVGKDEELIEEVLKEFIMNLQEDIRPILQRLIASGMGKSEVKILDYDYSMHR